jgi:nitrate reductase delta subunit
MNSRENAVVHLSQLLTYPGNNYCELVQGAPQFPAEEYPEAAARLRDFAALTVDFSLTRFQELFTFTFDLNPICCLEVGWQLHGEEYARGTFMVAMRDRLRSFGIEESGELPDHFCHVLLLLGRMEQEEATEFITSGVAPALTKMRAGVEGKDNPFEQVLLAVESFCGVLSGDREEVGHG